MPTPAIPVAHAVTQPTPSLVTELQLLVVDGGVKLVVGIIILVVGWMAATYAKRGLDAGLARLPIDLTLKPLISSLARYGILILTLLLVVQQFGVQTTSLIAVLGAAGLAVGLALQGTLSNVASGVMLLVLRPFRVGHFVEVAGGRQGTVREIGLFATLIITRDGVYVSIPNSSIFGAVVVNFTRERLRRVTFLVPVDRANDLDKARDVIVGTLGSIDGVMKEPAPSAIVFEIQEYTVVFKARCHVRSMDYWKVLWAAQQGVATALNQADVLLPVTRQAPVVRNEPQSVLTRAPSLDQPLDEAPQTPMSSGEKTARGAIQ
ncbi:MAG TPA: mechanosensitive ion channel family protein [Rhizomicrobium sp.]|nr:mechanosensitive ion channel family protein [Rhizomicrobium sp.]